MRGKLMPTRILWILILMQTKAVVLETQTANNNASLSLQADQVNILGLESHLAEDGLLNFTELAFKYDLECEEHVVITEDGYILKVFHVKGDKAQPVLLLHGVVDSADTFLIRGKTSLVATFARKGYDLWVGNCRGNVYSKKHVTLDPVADKEAFWNYNLQEIGVYDLPAMIDLVLNHTGQTQLQAIAHSQGNAVFYILGAEKPEYNDKLKLVIALAPISYLHHMKGLLPLLIPAWPPLSKALQNTGTYDLLARNSTFVRFIEILCTQKVIGYHICSSVVFSAAGADPEELEPEFLPILFGHFPVGVSVKNLDHFIQIYMNKRFQKYDYGLLKNLQLYGSVVPPDYDLKNVRMPIALLSGKNDFLSALEDVALLEDQLPNVVYSHVMDRELFNHIDFVWGKNMETNLFPIILDLLQKHNIDTHTLDNEPLGYIV